MENTELIKKFYTAFSNGNSAEMIECYHKDIVFKDPVFGELTGERACKMWEMLMAQKKESTTVTFSNVVANENTGSANWVAKYVYGEKQRKVTNEVSAHFTFKDGKIIKHTDSFDLWKWTKQALGAPGYLLGWSSFMKNKIQKTTNANLDTYIQKNS